MPGVPTTGTGLLRDHADFRDLTLETPAVREAIAKLRRRRGPRSTKPAQVDLREFLTSPPDLRGVQATAASAAAGLVEYFQRRTVGDVAACSPRFLYYTARRLAGTTGDNGAGLRSTLKALVRFGCPPEKYFAFDAAARDSALSDAPPDAFAFGFQREFADLSYVRLDPPGRSGDEVLPTLKNCLAAGFACVGGASIGAAAGEGGDIPYPTRHDSVAGATAFTVVGYDDAYRIRSTKGALLIRSTFGPQWGARGFGYLPYRFVTDRLAYDFWTLLKPQWLASGELEQIEAVGRRQEPGVSR